MVEAPASAFMLSEPLTWDQIRDRYPDQWVVLVELDWRDEHRNTGYRTARVAGTGNSRRASFDQARPFERGYSEIANPFTGIIARPIADLLP